MSGKVDLLVGGAHPASGEDCVPSSIKCLSRGSSLSTEHLAELRGSAISDDVIRSSGCYTAYDEAHLPDPLHFISNYEGSLPALVYPLVESGKGLTWQVKPQPGSVVFSDGKAPKYLCPPKESGYPTPTLVELRPVDDRTERVLLVEGTKQSMAALSVVDDVTAVYGLTGITSWKGGEAGPSASFQHFSDLPVFIIADADASVNRMVYDGAQQLGDHCSKWGAVVKFVEVPGCGKQGLDDVLAQIDSPEARGEKLDFWISRAQKKPARRAPKPSKNTPLPPKCLSIPDPGLDTSGQAARKPLVTDDLPPLAFWTTVADAVYSKFAGSRLFRLDKSLVEVVERDGRMCLYRVATPNLVDISAEAVDILHATDRRSRIRALTNTEAETIFNSSRVARYPGISGIVENPVLSLDGDVVCRPGYDEKTGLFLNLSPDLNGFTIPDSPSQTQVLCALELLESVYVDFPFKTESDKTRALSMLLTLLVRPSCRTAPMHVVSANTPGTGKGLLLAATSLIARGRDAQIHKLPHSDEEMNKVLISLLMAGQVMIVFDEASDGIDSPSLAALLTAVEYQGRILGASEHLHITNKSCVFAAGNNVAVKSDLGRRTLFVEMETSLARPEARDTFVHPDLLGWVADNRKLLLEAAFTLIRAWIVAGKPSPSPGQHVGGFEDWYNIVGGVLTFAGRGDLMQGVGTQRDRRNESVQEYIAHLEWLYSVFKAPFRAFEVHQAIRKTPGFVPLPPEINSPSDASAQRLGRIYSKLQDRNFEGFVIRDAGMVNHTKKFEIVRLDKDPSIASGGGPDDDPVDDPSDSSLGCSGAPTDGSPPTVVFDLATGDLSDLHTTSDLGFVRMAAYCVDGGDIVITSDIDRDLLPVLRTAGTLVGHGALLYDLPVLKRLFGFEPRADQCVHDTHVLALLADPPQGNKKYSLDAVASRYGFDGKLLTQVYAGVKKLSRKYGGFDHIPVNANEYVEYVIQNVRTTSALYEKLLPSARDAVGDAYVSYEHRVVSVLASVEASGVKIDVELLERVVAEKELDKERLRQWLVDTVGVPDSGKSPWDSVDGRQAIQAYLQRYGVSLPPTDTGSLSMKKDAFVKLSQQCASVPAVVELCGNMVLLRESGDPAFTVQKHVKSNGRVYPRIRPAQATGRLSTTEPGLTIFGSREDRLLQQRKLVLPDTSDQRLLSVDLSQIDARCMAAGAGDMAYAQLFQPGRDAHTEMALRVFNDESRRKDAKALAHAANYGMGGKKLAENAGISVDEANQMLDALRREFPLLEQFKQHLRSAATSLGYVNTAFGRRVLVERDKAYTVAPAAYGQGTARDVFLHGVLALPEDVQKMIRMFVHDEVVLSVPVDRVDEVREQTLAAFNSVQLPCTNGVPVPVLAEASPVGMNWAECEG